MFPILSSQRMGHALTVIGETKATVNLRGFLVPHVFVVIKDLNHKALAGTNFLAINWL